jgi:hypothetical protein
MYVCVLDSETREVFLAHVTHKRMTFGTSHLVATKILDDVDLASGTFSNHSSRSGFFDDMTG